MRGIKSKIAKPSAKKGSTLVELCIVMALVSIVATMIATFSVLVVTYVNENQGRYDFIEESSELREDIADWLCEADVAGGGIAVSADKLEYSSAMAVSFDAGSKSIVFSDMDGVRTTDELKSVVNLKFSLNTEESVLLCSVFGRDKSGEVFKRNFAFTLHASGFIKEGADA